MQESQAFLLNNIEHLASQVPRRVNPLIRRNYKTGNEQRTEYQFIGQSIRTLAKRESTQAPELHGH